MAAAAVMALVIDAIHTTVSMVIGAFPPSSRLPKAPSYRISVPVAAIATTPGIAVDSTAWRRIRSMVFRPDMFHLRVGRATGYSKTPCVSTGGRRGSPDAGRRDGI